MPHVELNGSAALDQFHARFEPRTLTEPGRIVRAEDSFLSRDARSLLVECVVVEGYLRQSFFVLMTERPGGIMVRLLPRTSPEKTAGVRRCLAWVAAWVLALEPSTRVGTTNLEEVFAQPFPPESLPRSAV